MADVWVDGFNFHLGWVVGFVLSKHIPHLIYHSIPTHRLSQAWKDLFKETSIHVYMQKLNHEQNCRAGTMPIIVLLLIQNARFLNRMRHFMDVRLCNIMPRFIKFFLPFDPLSECSSNFEYECLLLISFQCNFKSVFNRKTI